MKTKLGELNRSSKLWLFTCVLKEILNTFKQTGFCFGHSILPGSSSSPCPLI